MPAAMKRKNEGAEEVPNKRIRTTAPPAPECDGDHKHLEKAHKKAIVDLKKAYGLQMQKLKDEHAKALKKLKEANNVNDGDVAGELAYHKRAFNTEQSKVANLTSQLQNANKELKALKSENYKLQNQLSNSKGLSSRIEQLEKNLETEKTLSKSIKATTQKTQKAHYIPQIEKLENDLESEQEVSATANHKRRLCKMRFEKTVAELEKCKKYIRYLKKAHMVNSPHVDMPVRQEYYGIEGVDVKGEPEHRAAFKKAEAAARKTEEPGKASSNEEKATEEVKGAGERETGEIAALTAGKTSQDV